MDCKKTRFIWKVKQLSNTINISLYPWLKPYLIPTFWWYCLFQHNLKANLINTKPISKDGEFDGMQNRYNMEGEQTEKEDETVDKLRWSSTDTCKSIRLQKRTYSSWLSSIGTIVTPDLSRRISSLVEDDKTRNHLFNCKSRRKNWKIL